MKWLSYFVTAMFTGLSFAHALGGNGSGGGSGCMGQFMKSAYKTSLRLEKQGASLKPQVDSDEFVKAIDPNSIKETADDLRFNGNAVDAFYDGQNIKIRCDRLMAEQPDVMEYVIAHEIFRKMGLESDHYEVSRQLYAEFSTRKEAVVRSPIIANFAIRYKSRTVLMHNPATGEIIVQYVYPQIVTSEGTYYLFNGTLDYNDTFDGFCLAAARENGVTRMKGSNVQRMDGWTSMGIRVADKVSAVMLTADDMNAPPASRSVQIKSIICSSW